METYVEKLRSSAEKANSIVCFGLDPVVDAMPEKYTKHGIKGFVNYLGEITDEMRRQGLSPGAFKPNQGWYFAHDRQMQKKTDGTDTLRLVIMNILRKDFPDIPLILDFKRGDIATSSDNYATEGFESWEADAVTVSPYMGSDSVGPFIKHTANGKGIYILNRTSNSGAKDFQNLDTVAKIDTLTQNIDDTVSINRLYQFVADKIIEWSQGNPGVGAVVGATSLDELKALATLYAGKDIPLLIPGVGGQGGSAKDVADILRQAGYDLRLARINSSSGLTHPWKKPPVPADYVKRSIDEIVKLNEEIGKLAA